MNKAVVLIIICVVISISLMLDYKTVELEYKGMVKVTPPISYYRGDSHYSFFIRRGDTLKKYLENSLFPESIVMDDETLHSNPFPKYQKYKLFWENDLEIIDGDFYYVALGCEIEKISYFYHTKYINYLNDNTIFIDYSTKLKSLKDKSIINIYHGDVAVIE